MMQVKLGLLLVAICLSAMACSGTASPTTNQTQPAASGATPSSTSQDEFAAARAIFTRDCTKCHGSDGSGGPIKLDDGTTLRIPSLREGHAVKHKDEELVKQITDGGDGMPKFGDKLSRQEIIDLMRFIRKEFQAK